MKTTTRARIRLAAAVLFCVVAAPQFTSVARAQTQSDGTASSAKEKTPSPQEKPIAQDPPVGVQGTEVGTEETPAAATNSDALRNAAQNPIASLVSVPVQNIDNFNIGPADRTQNIVNIQPVIPLSLSTNWNLVVRWIMPIIYQPVPVPQPPPGLRCKPLESAG